MAHAPALLIPSPRGEARACSYPRSERAREATSFHSRCVIRSGREQRLETGEPTCWKVPAGGSVRFGGPGPGARGRSERWAV